MQHLIVTGMRSLSHGLYLAAFVQSLLTGQTQKIVVTVHRQPAFLGAAEYSLADLREILPRDERVSLEDAATSGARKLGWEFMPEAQAFYVAVGSVGGKAWWRLRRSGQRFHTIIIDEGIGSYGSLRTRWLALRREGASRGSAAIKAGARTILAHWGKRHPAYWQHGNTWVADENLRKVLKFARNYGESAETFAGTTASVTRTEAIILPQPWVELGLTDAVHVQAYVAEMAQWAKSSGFQPYVRPHPAQQAINLQGLAVPLISNSIPAELDPRCVRAGMIIGGPSTALLHLAAFFGVPAQWCSPPGGEVFDEQLSARQRSLLEFFLGKPLVSAQDFSA